MPLQGQGDKETRRVAVLDLVLTKKPMENVKLKGSVG